MKTTAREYAGRGIVANSIAPGFIKTGGWRQRGAAGLQLGGDLLACKSRLIEVCCAMRRGL